MIEYPMVISESFFWWSNKSWCQWRWSLPGFCPAQLDANSFWSCWIKEHVSKLNGKTNSQTLVENRQVLRVVEHNKPRDYYPTSQITHKRYGSDSVGRSAALSTLAELLLRPLVHLRPIFQAYSPGSLGGH